MPLPSARAGLVHEGAASPEEFNAFVLPPSFGSALVRESLSTADTRHGETEFFMLHPQISTWDQLLGYLYEKRDALVMALDSNSRANDCTQTEAYRSLCEAVREKKVCLRAEISRSNLLRKDPAVMEHFKLIEKMYGLAQGLYECESIIVKYDEEPCLLGREPLYRPTCVMGDGETFLGAPSSPARIDCYPLSDLSKVVEAARSVGAHYLGHSRPLPARCVGTTACWSTMASTAAQAKGHITTTYSSGHLFESGSSYWNRIEPGRWTFIDNDRVCGPFANQVFPSQYLLVAKRDGFLGWLPATVTRSAVRNVTTNAIMHKHISGTDAALAAFLSETPNGKSTQRILNVFDLRATAIEYNQVADRNGLHTYHLAVEPTADIKSVVAAVKCL